MRAVLYRDYGPPGVLELVDLPRPDPVADQVLIRVAAVGVGPGDCKTRQGLLHAFHPAVFPKIPGRSGTGHVVALGPDARGVTPGDLVYFSTEHTEQGCSVDYLCRPIGGLLRLDPGMDPYAVTAVMHPAICAWLALTETAQLARDQRVLIVGGSGAIGVQSIRLAAHLGARVTAIGSRRHVDTMIAAGAHAALSHADHDSLPAGLEVDVVFDLIGGAAQTNAVSHLRPGGRLVYLQAAPVSGPPRADVLSRRVSVRYGPDVAAVVQGLLNSAVLTPAIGPILTPDQCRKAHRLVEAGGLGPRRVVLDFAET